MPDIGKALRDEIARIAKREAAKLVAEQNKTIRTLKQDIAAVKKSAAKPPRKSAPAAAPAATAQTDADKNAPAAPAKTAGKPRFTADSIKKLRARLGLSQVEFAKLCGVSANSVGNWETAGKGRLDLRPSNLEALAKVRAMRPAKARQALSESAS